MAVTIGIAAGFVCGADPGSPVWDKYKPPSPFAGTIYNVTVDVSGKMVQDEEKNFKVM